MITIEQLKQSNRKFFRSDSFFHTKQMKIVGNRLFLKNCQINSSRELVYSYPVYKIDPVTKHLDFEKHVDKIRFEYAEFDQKKLNLD